MSPALKHGDRLDVVPCGSQKIRAGDVIVFHNPQKDGKIAHRVISVRSGGIRTRGDNNPHPDPILLPPDRVIGRVMSVHRGNRSRRIAGGWTGRLFGAALTARRRIDVWMTSLLYPLYISLSRSAFVKRWIKGRLAMHVLCLERPEGREMQLLHKGRLIGRRFPKTVRWQIRRPFRLFVDEDSLPADALE